MARDMASLGDIVTQLKITNKLLVAKVKADGQMRQIDLIVLLAATEASPKEIAEALNTTEGTVRTTLQRLRKKAKGKEEAQEE